jgi:hypothetical protein
MSITPGFLKISAEASCAQRPLDVREVSRISENSVFENHPFSVYQSGELVETVTAPWRNPLPDAEKSGGGSRKRSASIFHAVTRSLDHRLFRPRRANTRPCQRHAGCCCGRQEGRAGSGPGLVLREVDRGDMSGVFSGFSRPSVAFSEEGRISGVSIRRKASTRSAVHADKTFAAFPVSCMNGDRIGKCSVFVK